ncbi:high-affinity Fe2+/Pb2+ permease [Embleya sp. AB8]
MTRVRTRTLLIAGVLLAVVLAGFVSYYASKSPDGLEKVSADKGINAKEQDHQFKDGPLADYNVKGVHNERLSGGLAGVIGVAATLLVGTGVFWLVRKRNTGTATGTGTAADPTPSA